MQKLFLKIIFMVAAGNYLLMPCTEFASRIGESDDPN